jgi:PAS domain S-box-containing protein
MSAESATYDPPHLGEALVRAFSRTRRPYALVRADPDGSGRIVKGNVSLEELTGRTGSGLIGADVLEVLGCGRRPEAREVMRGVVEGEVPFAELQSRLVRPDGRMVSTEIELAAADGDPLTGRWVFVAARDITAEVRAAQERHRACWRPR